MIHCPSCFALSAERVEEHSSRLEAQQGEPPVVVSTNGYVEVFSCFGCGLLWDSYSMQRVSCDC